MMNPQTVNVAMCDALGLNPNVVEAIHLVFEARKAPAVIVHYLPSPDQINKMADVIAQYQLAEKP